MRCRLPHTPSRLMWASCSGRVDAVRAGLQSVGENPLGFVLSTATASIDFVVKNDGTISIVWEGEYAMNRPIRSP